MDFVVAVIGGDRRFVYFVAQTRTLVASLVFCFRLFPGGTCFRGWDWSTIPFFVIPWSSIISSIWPASGPLRWPGRGWPDMANIVFPRKALVAFGFCAGLLLILGILSWQQALELC